MAPRVTAWTDLEAYRKKKLVQLQSKWKEAKLPRKVGEEGLEEEGEVCACPEKN